jgi:meso-butanediol dehydrogenase/(S,S)-butanediol dehydrogenase/diacetyl reductase
MHSASLEGTVVAITGAGRGIGLGIARHLALRGARLVLGDLDEAAAQAAASFVRETGAQALGVALDVRLADDNAALVDAAVRAWGRLDVIVCNAGIMQVRPFLELEATDWERMLSVNVTGVFLSMQAAARRMLEQAPLAQGRPQGKIVAIASIAGRAGAGPIAGVMPHYRASKAAVISLVQSAAATFAPRLTVNAICPGVVDTAMWEGIDRDLTALQGSARGEAWRQRVAGVPMGRAQQPEDVAGVAAFLASAASDYMTGQSINIDGGLVMS